MGTGAALRGWPGPEGRRVALLMLEVLDMPETEDMADMFE